MKYVALLRGINVGGKNPVKMAELKTCFEELGFQNVSTYINSGNLLFETERKSDAKLVRECSEAFLATFGFSVPLAVISAAEFEDAMKHAPSWWGKNPDDKNNALFVIAPAKAEAVMEQVGEAKPEYEKVEAHGPIIFWTAPLRTFNRTRYKDVVSSRAYQSITIRNANTTNKLLSLLTEK
jgi:uncharacterized protein (DUF1697 family)